MAQVAITVPRDSHLTERRGEQHVELCGTPNSRSQFIGTWYLKAMYSINTQTGDTTHPLGKEASGQIMYTSDGHMGVYISSEGDSKGSKDLAVPMPAVESRCVGFPESDSMICKGREFVAYGGTFDVDTENQGIVHHVRHCIISDAVGGDLVRNFEFGKDAETGEDTLELYTLLPPVKHSLLWQRATPHVG